MEIIHLPVFMSLGLIDNRIEMNLASHVTGPAAGLAYTHEGVHDAMAAHLQVVLP